MRGTRKDIIDWTYLNIDEMLKQLGLPEEIRVLFDGIGYPKG